MLVVTATQMKNQLGSLLDALEKDEGFSVLIKRKCHPAAMLLNAQVAEKTILAAYAHGVLPRAVAMQQLGLHWYGDLLQLLYKHGIERTRPSAADAVSMRQAAEAVFKTSARSVP